eukprot:3169853-Pyramimonas_sp.AAC.1
MGLLVEASDADRSDGFWDAVGGEDASEEGSTGNDRLKLDRHFSLAVAYNPSIVHLRFSSFSTRSVVAREEQGREDTCATGVAEVACFSFGFSSLGECAERSEGCAVCDAVTVGRISCASVGIVSSTCCAKPFVVSVSASWACKMDTSPDVTDVAHQTISSPGLFAHLPV